MSQAASNPLLQDWNDQPYGLPPFARIEAAHFAPAFEAALAEHRAELDRIAAQAEPPSFENTIAAFDRSGRLLARLEHLFYTLGASATSPELQAAQRALAAPLAAHGNAVYMHAALFKRVDALYAERQALRLSPEQLRLLERIHLDFVRAGAKLQGEAQSRYAQVVERLAELHTLFGQNVLADESSYQLLLRSEDELAGLPDFVRAAARQAAVDRGLGEDASAHVITLSRSLIVPFLSFSERRDLREQAWRAWIGRGEKDGATDNRAVAQEILTLRKEQARLHGHACYADYALADTMAGSREAVLGLLNQVWEPAKQAAAAEREQLEGMMTSLDHRFPLEAWDWRFYAEKVRKARYELDDAEVKPYFSLDAMVQALFDCAGRLFGLKFLARPQVAGYHPDVKVYEVQGADGALRGVFVQDNFARPTKRSGAWMNALRWQARNGIDALPIILNNNNFAKGAAGEPTLLSFDDARTLFHEFGHGLHGLLSDVEYERLSGTQVLRDFVELPSQIFEHWINEPEVLKQHARHYKTGEPIPDVLLAKIKAAELFNQGYETVRYTASALVDLAVHSRTEAQGPDITAFEAQTMADYGLPAAIGMNHRLAHFQHLFSGSGYAAGYYVYMWAEVLDADGYEAFKEAGNPFDAQVAQRLLTHIYAAGNSCEPRATYRAFRGRDAQVQPMLRGRGLLV
ncbi:M3 family metallopeptidase [Kinneretia asaccharophila]|uniref:Peptidyl-dipeptidase Dcp n=1 Tax=Roseateles asaccharophilus TaxID=582607 RepID=A0A4R6NDU3_9BURK|nr:M3 family metallopeptidase [Roseateles asaccharophilus]MDN3543601.1 M3 family metallopeptidase [Roseateles asaccharophilus]TDP12023.1 peptidyl-dipeptidase Dcp [Roseateles asaccharophilus]